MAIQVRRGKKKDFDPDKMLPGEWAGTTDTKEVFFTFAPGDTKKMATYEDMEENIREATGEITAGLTEGISTAIEQANAAADTANQAAETAQASITDLTEDVAVAIENSNTASNTAIQAAQEAQDAAQEAREAATGIGSVTGIKGDKETEYRQGNINLTPEDLGALSTTGDANANTVTFTSNDSGPEGDHGVWEVEKLTTGETLSSILQKVSRMFTNIRYLLRLVGTTDISAISDGTITGAVKTFESNLKWKLLTTLHRNESFQADMTQYNEILAIFSYADSEGAIRKYSIHVPVLELTEIKRTFATGSYQNDTQNRAYFIVAMSLNEVQTTNYFAYYNTNNISNNTTVNVYVR